MKSINIIYINLLNFINHPATARILSRGGRDCSKIYTATPEYTYDYNGNLTQDLNKGILSITYNTLNLPISVNKTTGNRVEYVYDAAGTKCRQLYYSSGNPTKTTDFVGNFVYENNVPVSVLYPEGRVVLNSTGPRWH